MSAPRGLFDFSHCPEPRPHTRKRARPQSEDDSLDEEDIALGFRGRRARQDRPVADPEKTQECEVISDDSDESSAIQFHSVSIQGT